MIEELLMEGATGMSMWRAGEGIGTENPKRPNMGKGEEIRGRKREVKGRAAQTRSWTWARWREEEGGEDWTGGCE